ncbi:MAG: hypothetical protein U0L79_10805 [Lachnospiraceae bacterium]|nr:hypothetical protein [Lachnospiraceae bacterium]
MARIFVCSEVIKVINKSIDVVNKDTNEFDEEFMKAWYMYTYSVFESTLTEILRYYLLAFPEKIEKNISISKEQLLASPLTSDVTLDIIQSFIRGYSSDTLISYISFFMKTLAISVDVNNDKIQQIAMKRNIIVHDSFSLVINHKYIDMENRMDMKKSELEEGIKYLNELLVEIAKQIHNKYRHYTFEKVCRTIWEETFSTPLLKFDDVWSIDGGVIHIKDFNASKKKYKWLSSSEKTLFSIFVHQYSGTLNDRLFEFRDISAICSLDINSRKKVINIIQLFIAYPHLFNGKNLNEAVALADVNE